MTTAGALPLTEQLREAADELDALVGEAVEQYPGGLGTCDGCAEYKTLTAAYRTDDHNEPWLCAECVVEHEAPRRQAVLIRTLVAEHQPEPGLALEFRYVTDGPLCRCHRPWPCPTIRALQAAFLPNERGD